MTVSTVVGGLHFDSALPMHGFAAPAGTRVDVVVEVGPVPSAIDAPLFSCEIFSLSRREYLLAVDGIGRFYVSNGERVVVEPAAQIDPDELEVMLLGPVFGALCQQRGRVALHASAVGVDGRAVAFMGRSGMGKSTLARVLVDRGYPLLSDDLCVIELRDDAVFMYPFAPQFKLWRETMLALEEDPDLHPTTRVDLGKHWVRDVDHVDHRAVRLDEVHVLAATRGANSEAGITRIRGARSIAAIANHTFRRRFFEKAEMTGEHVAACEAVANHARLYRLNRYQGVQNSGRTVDMLEAHWSQNEQDSPSTPNRERALP